MKSVISSSQTCSGCSLVLHNLLDEDTGPLGAVASRPDRLARVGRSVQQRAAKLGLLRGPLCCSPGIGLTSPSQCVPFSGSIFPVSFQGGHNVLATDMYPDFFFF